MALVVTCLNMKGGVGKTTTALALAESAAVATRTLLIDADAMGSAFRWSQLAAEGGQPLRSTVVPMAVADLPRRLPAAAGGYGVVVVDAPPPGPGAQAIAGAAISAAGLVVMPTPPELASLDRIPATAKEAADRGTPALAVLTMVRAGLPERDAARAALDGWGVPVAAAECPLSVSVQRCYGQAVTGILARFGYDLLSEVLDLMEASPNG